MNQMPPDKYLSILRFVKDNPGVYSPEQVARKFEVSIRTMYRIKDRTDLPFREAAVTACTGFFNWKQYRGGVI